MPVTDDMVATVRAYLSGDSEKFRRLNRERDKSRAATRSYVALITAAFADAVERRFTAQTPESEIIEFVAELRSRSDRLSEQLDPTAAERLMMAVFRNDVDTRGLDGDTTLTAKLLVASAIMADADLDSAELEEFLDKARVLANEILG